jgi:hypothetical protein
MAKVSPLQGSFNAGELSPLLYGRVDADRYKAGLATCLNYVPIIQGGKIRRPGTAFVAEIKDSTKTARLVPFEFSTTQAYVLEFSDQYVRFYKDNGQILNTSQAITGITNANPCVVTYAGADTFTAGDEVFITGITGAIGSYLNGRNFLIANVSGAANTFELKYLNGTAVNSTTFGAYGSGGTVASVYQIASVYTESEIFDLSFTQSADTLYIAHPSHAPKTLTRTGHTSWTFDTLSLFDGPYLSTNGTSTTLTPSATSGSVTITASAATFASTDVGRWIRIKHSTTWGYGIITAYTDSTHVTLVTRSSFGATTASSTWRFGLWSDTTGYPSTVVFHEDRLFFGGSALFPQRLDGSVSGIYGSFSPTDPDGTVNDSNAVSFSLNANDVNVVRWLVSDEKGLLAGTVAGEWLIRPSSTGEALTPTNVTAKRSSSYGSADIQPLQVGKATLFVQRAGRKVREMTYFYDVDGFRAPDMTVLSEHVTAGGLVQMAHQKEPFSVLWCAREDGVLAAMTYERELDELKVGWSRHILGGTGDAAGGDPEVESVAAIPSSDGTRVELWVIVKRYVNGATKRYVEYLTKYFEDTDEQKDAFFVDCGLTYDAPVTITGATKANPVVVTAAAHGFSNGDKVLISGVEGMTNLNGHSYVVANKGPNTFELTAEDGGTGNVDGTAFSTYVSGGEARKYVSTISGLWHLEGATVDLLADGAVLPETTVTNGAITLTAASTTVQIGYGYNSDAQMLRLEAGAQDGTALGKTRRTHRVGFLLHRSLGLKVGVDFDNLATIVFRTSSDDSSRAVPLYSGIISERLEADYDFENQVCWRQDQPLPSTILAVMPQLVTQDRG